MMQINIEDDDDVDHWAIIVKMLLVDQKIDPSTNDNHAIRFSAVNGRTDVVRLLIEDPRVNPSANSNEAIRRATRNGHTETVKVLLADPRVDPSADNNEAIRYVAGKGYTKIVAMLLQDKRIWLKGCGYKQENIVEVLNCIEEKLCSDIVRTIVEEWLPFIHA